MDIKLAQSILDAADKFSEPFNLVTERIRLIDDEAIRKAMLRSLGEVMRHLDEGIYSKIERLHPSLKKEDGDQA